jgi:hypothetical protein
MQFQYEDVLITCEKDLDQFTTAEMVDLHNQAGVDIRPVKKFENRAAGMRLTWAKLTELGKKCNFYAPPKSTKVTAIDVQKDGQIQATKKVRAKAAEKAPRDTKHARLIAMLSRPAGATIEEIMEAFGWLRHTCRGYIFGNLKGKHGWSVESVKLDGRRTYRIYRQGE